MSIFQSPSRRLALSTAIALAVVVGGPALAKGPTNAYAVHNLVSDGVVPADHTDPNMKNTWGVAFNPAGFVWVTNNHSGTSTLYDGLGNPQSLVVAIPPADPLSSDPGAPDGIVFSGTSDFVVTNGTLSGPSRFIFASEDGLIAGWAPNVDFTHAMRAVTTPGAIYKGLALATSSTGVRLYATDFHNGHVDMFDSAFNKVVDDSAFVDPRLPNHMAPFGIQAIGDRIYVAYARQDKEKTDNTTGPGIVSVFTTDGKYIKRGAQQDGLNAPWGVAMAPADFGPFSGDLLVANFGDGTISAFDPSYHFLDRLRDADGNIIRIPGLWGIQFGNGLNSQPTNTLFFAAGPNEETNGLYGSIALTVRNPAK